MSRPPLVAAPWEPACMDPDEWAAWRSLNGRVSGSQRAARPCSDCLLGYAAEMRAEGRCNGTPGGDAADDEEEHDMDTVTTSRTTPTRIAVEAPCRTCSHAPVCRLRDTVIDAGTVSVPVPMLGDGIAIRLTGTVDCDWYVKDRSAAPQRITAKRDWSPEQRAAAAERARQMMAARKAAKEAA